MPVQHGITTRPKPVFINVTEHDVVAMLTDVANAFNMVDKT